MANDVKLQEGHPVDENLRPLKVGGESTALELSKDDVRVNNLYVKGTTSGVSASDSTKLPLAGGTMTGDITTDSNIVSTNLTIDDAGSISLDATSSNATTGILLKNAGTLIGDLTVHHSGTYLTLYENGGASGDDYIDILCAANGASTIRTVDAAGSDADLIITADGDLQLKFVTGKFIMEDSNGEFSVAGSAYAGMILGYTTVGIDATQDSYTLSSTMTVLDDAMKVKFIAPPSGNVEISAQIYFDASRRIPRLGLSDANATTGYSAINFPNTDDVTNEHIQAVPPISAGDSMLRPHWVVTGLTAGTAYEWWFAAATVVGAGGVLKWGGTATSEYPPFIMKATALPTAVADYAVYG